MQKINPFIANINFKSISKKPKEQIFANSYIESRSQLPVYLQPPYGIQAKGYVKLGVDKLPNGQEIHIYRLLNGQKVQIIKKDGETSVVTQVNVGAFDEKGYPRGIAHFIEHSVFHGSKTYNTDLMKELNKITTFNNASTSSKETRYYMDLSSDSLEALNYALDIQSDMLLRPTFSSIEKEKPIVRAEYQEDMLDDFNIMYENLLKILFRYSNTNEASITGNDETINSITKADMNRFHSNFYKPSNMTTIITSKHNPDDVINLVANNFVSKSSKNIEPVDRQDISLIDKTTRSDIITNNSSDGSVFLSFVCPNLANNFEKLKMDALGSIFCSRYMNSLSLDMQSSNVGLVSCRQTLDEDKKPNEAIQDLYQKIIDFKTKPISNQEVEDVKKELLKNLDISFNSGNIAVMKNILEVMNDGSNYIAYEAYKQMIHSLTPQNIYEMVKYLDLNKAAIVVSHSKDSTTEKIQETDKKFPYVQMPIDIAGNSYRVDYAFNEHCNQLTGDKFYSTTLQDGSRLYLINSPDDNCEIDWKLLSENNYSSNPASKYILNYLYTQKIMGFANYSTQDEIVKSATCETKELDDEIAHMKSFTHLQLTQKDFEDAKKDALKDIDDASSSVFKQFCQTVYGSKYITSKEYLKQQIEKLTLNDVVNDLNNMVLNARSSYVVKAPIFKNPNLAQDIANMLNCPNLHFRTQEQNTQLIPHNINADCVVSVDNANQNKIAQGYNFTISKNPKDYFIFSLLAEVIADKNHDTIREKMGLAYYSGASYEQKGNQGMLILNTEASCNNKGDLEKIFTQYEQNFNSILNGQVTQEELLLAKNKLKGYLKSCFNDKNTSMFELLHEFAFDFNMINSLNSAGNIIDSITVDDINRAANYISRNKPQKILIAKQSLLDENSNYINSLGKIEKR